MARLSFLFLLLVAGVVLALAFWGGSGSYRYKLTLAVDTPDGVKSGSSVVEVQVYDVSLPMKGVMHRLEGEALYLDLSSGKRPLVALLTNQLHHKHWDKEHWSRDGGPVTGFLFSLYNEKPPIGGLVDEVSRLARLRGPRAMTPTDLPDLVTFADVDNPKSVIEVDPNDLQATLGPGIKWHEITLESTDEPVTKGIEMKLPWLRTLNAALDGSRYHDSNELSNVLGAASFSQPGIYTKRN
ncbi:MAG: hypothetical protein ACLPTZ_28510 [Beijerinckiaceae bacterium]